MKNDMNFLPEDYLEKKAQQRTNIICLVLFALVISAVSVGWFITEKRRRVMVSEQQEMVQKMTLAAESLKKLDELEKKKVLMKEKAELSAMLTEPVPRSLLLATVTNNLPSGVSLLSYELESKEVKQPAPPVSKKKTKTNKKEPEKPKIKPKQFETLVDFIGVANSDLEVAQLIKDLSISHLMSNVSLSYSEEFFKNDLSYRKFEIKSEISPEIRATEEDVQWARKQHMNRPAKQQIDMADKDGMKKFFGSFIK